MDTAIDAFFDWAHCETAGIWPHSENAVDFLTFGVAADDEITFTTGAIDA